MTNRHSSTFILRPDISMAYFEDPCVWRVKEKASSIAIRPWMGWWHRILRRDMLPAEVTQQTFRDLWSPEGHWAVAARFDRDYHLGDLCQAMLDGEKDDVAGAVYVAVSAYADGRHDEAQRFFHDEVLPSLNWAAERRRARSRQHMIEQAQREAGKRKMDM